VLDNIAVAVAIAIGDTNSTLSQANKVLAETIGVPIESLPTPDSASSSMSHAVQSPTTSNSSRIDEYMEICIIRVVEALMQREALTRFGHALSDPTRTQILLSLRTGPAYPSDMAETIGVSRQILSNHLACLRGCGLVVTVPEGRRSRYELADPRIAAALENLLGLVLAVDPACCPATATEECC
jgi:DNA-binding transcriptional ArsR family regulator